MGDMITKQSLLSLGVLALVVIGLISWGINTKTPHVAVVSPEELQSVASVSPDTTPTLSRPHSPDRAVAPQTKQITSPTPPKDIVLDLSSEFARVYEKQLTPFLKLQADFNKHFVVARWTCGSDCTLTGVIDKSNGRAYLAPSDVYGSRTPGPYTPYSLESNIFRVVNEDVIDVYRFEAGRFVLESIEQL